MENQQKAETKGRAEIFLKLCPFIVKNKNVLLSILAALGIISRLLFIFIWEVRTTTDSYNYIAQAEAIINGSPVSSFPNGYPIIISLILVLFGKAFLFEVLIALNLCAQILTGFILYKLSMILGYSFLESPQFKNFTARQKEGLVFIFAISVLIIFAFYPTQIYYTDMILTESITTLIITLTAYFFARSDFFLTGLFFAAAAYIKTTLLLIGPIVILIMLITKKGGAGKLALGFFLSVFIFLILDISGVTKLPGNHDYNLLIAVNGFSSDINHDLSNFTEEEINNPVKTYLSFAVKNTSQFLLQRLDALYGLWGPYPFEINNKIIRLIFGFRFILFAAFVLFIITAIKLKSFGFGNVFGRFASVLSIYIIVLTFIHVFYFSSFRFIVPVEPLLHIALVSTIYYTFLHKNLNKRILGWGD